VACVVLMDLSEPCLQKTKFGGEFEHGIAIYLSLPGSTNNGWEVGLPAHTFRNLKGE
jgi:hypothetical protein